jgi:hypothetical protein
VTYVEVVAGLPLIRQRLSFLNERLLVSALVKSNDLLMVKLNELHGIWINLNCLPEWRIVRESLTEFNLHLVDLTFVARVHNGVRMGLRGVDESLFPIIAPRLFRDQPSSIPPVQRPRVWSELGYFWMTGTRAVLDCVDTAVF